MQSLGLQEQFVQTLTVLAELCQRQLSKALTLFYVDQIKDYGMAIAFLKKKMASSKSPSDFPTVEDILKACGQAELDPLEEAREIVQKIKAAVSKHGHWNPDPARTFIGEKGWKTVEMMGGWKTVCSYDSYEALDMALAQAREYTKVTIVKERFEKERLALGEASPDRNLLPQ